MQVPALLYGEYAEVRKRCRRALTRYLRGQEPLLDALTSDGMLETADHLGLSVLVAGESLNANHPETGARSAVICLTHNCNHLHNLTALID
jgi:hypothetical protein